MLKKITVTLLVTLIIFAIYLISTKSNNKKKIKNTEIEESTDIYKANLLENVEYISKDAKGNEYIIRALKGEIDFNNSEIIFLEKVKSKIKLKDSDMIIITSDFGKYNTNNFDTIFSKNVVITYLENKITSNYLDFSLDQNKMIISKNVIFTNMENILEADVVEMNIKTKDTKIFMYENQKKINIKSKNY